MASWYETPAEIVRRAACAPHDNAGPLSVEHGFLPARPPRTRLPDSHRPWDDVAAELPALHARLALRDRIETLPHLSAATLPDDALTRAATVLGILVHAHHRVEPRRAATTPTALLRPWREVCHRLGRAAPHLSYADLVVMNWRHAADEATGPVRVEKTRLLTPTVGVPEEEVFYLAQLEMLARGTPLVAASLRARDAIAADDAPALAHCLAAMAETVHDVTVHGLPKISPRPGSRFHVDPVVWAKTVAPLAVPLTPGGLGPSGTASPMFHLLDAVIGRTDYASPLGEETLRLRRAFPPHWREFVAAVFRVGVRAYTSAARHPALTRELAALRAGYAGEGGLLQRHHLKVIGYIDTATRVGRDVTIAGFHRTGRISRELTTTRATRREPAAEGSVRPPDPRDDWPVHTPGELLARHRGADRQWIALGAEIADVTGFLRRHPGGPTSLAAYLGTDAATAYERTGHHLNDGVRAQVRRLRVGTLAAPPLPGGPVSLAYDAWVSWATQVTIWANALHGDVAIRWARTSAGAPAGELTPYTMQFAIEAHERFLRRVAQPIATTMVEELTGRPAPEISWTGEGLYGLLDDALDRGAGIDLVDRAWQSAAALDAAFVDSVRETLGTGVRWIETRRSTAGLGELADRVVAGARAYASRAARPPPSSPG